MGKYRKIFAKNLLEAMQFRAITKADLCRKAKIDRMSLDKYLAAEVSAGLDKIESLANALDVAPESLVSNPAPGKDVDPYCAALIVREHLKLLALDAGVSWPPSIEFLAKILKENR